MDVLSSYTPAARPLRLDDLPPLRSQRPPAAGRLPRPLAQLRRRRPDRLHAGDPAPGLRPRHHALRPGQQLRAAVRRRRDELRARSIAQDFRPLRDELVISTKAGYDMWPGPVRRVGLAQVPAVLAGPVAGAGWAWTTSTSSTPTGSTRRRRSRRRWGPWRPPCSPARRCYAGISSYSPERTREAAALLRDMGVPLLIHQPSYSMLNRWVEDGLLDALEDEGIGCIAFSPLAQGMLTRPLPRRHPRGLPCGPREVAVARPADRAGTDAHPAAQRHRGGAGPVAGPAGPGLGAARPAGHVGADRGQQRRGSSRPTSPRWTTSRSRAEELAQIDADAVDSGINLWAASSED